MPARSGRLRRRDPGYTSSTELDAVLAPFSRPPALTPCDLPDTFIVHERYCGSPCFPRMEFTPSARTRLLKHFDTEQADTALERLEWIEIELGGVFNEARGYATRYTHPQLVAALRALARLDPALAPPMLPPALLTALRKNERRASVLAIDERYGIEPSAREAGDILHVATPDWADLGTLDLMRCADALFHAVRRRLPNNWELLARQSQWEPLRQGVIELCARLWVNELERPADAATKPLLALTLELLPMVDPTFSRSPSEDAVERIRTRLAQALSKFRNR